ncbi:hypothetical protein [Nonomuraea sp. NPDC050310]|uniref:hypothetical protein n=1 Tax=Nonomuraea sp. NPDC050310 TaxID=3154935 RepID=UPI0033F1D19A
MTPTCRHCGKTFPPDRQQPGETWTQYMRRRLPAKVIRAAEERRAREVLLWRWPRVAVMKTEYRRRRR